MEADSRTSAEHGDTTNGATAATPDGARKDVAMNDASTQTDQSLIDALIAAREQAS
jgi:hypothetical protein